MNLKTFLKDNLKWQPEWIDAFTGDEPPTDETIAAIETQMDERNRELFTAKYGDELRKSAIEEGKKNGALTYGGTLKTKIGRKLGMTMTRAEYESMNDDEFFTAIEKHVSSKLNEASQMTDGKAKQTIEELQRKYQTAVDDFNQLKIDMDDRIAAAQAEAENRVEQFKVNDLKTKTMATMQWSPHVDREAGHMYISSLIDQNYKVSSDGKITNKDGTRALRPDGHGFYDTFEDAYKDLFEKRGYNQKSNAGTGDRGVTVQGKEGAQSPVVTDDNALDVLKKQRESVGVKTNAV